ncbi:MAG: tail fiber domain-containing protein, partial [Bacteroidota bacterium]
IYGFSSGTGYVFDANASGNKTGSYSAARINNFVTGSNGSSNKIGLTINSTGSWTGAGSTNKGLAVTVSGGTSNIAATFMGGGIGIGTVFPSEKLHIYDGKLKVSDSSYSALLYQTGSKTTLETENPFVINPNGGGTAFQIDDGDAIFEVPTTINDPLRINDGTQGLNKVFVSDASGFGSWINLTSLPGALSGGTTNYVTKWSSPTALSSSSLIYDDGNSVGIGITIPGPSMLNVNVPTSNTSDYNAITVNNSYNGTLSKYGLNITNDANGSGAKYGLYANVIGSATSGSGVFGTLYDIAPNGSGSAYGIYSILTGVGTGLRYGFYNSVSTSSTSISTVRGVYNLINPSGSGAVYGVHNNLQTGGTGIRYGISNEVTTSAANAGLVYGTYNSLTPNGTGVAYSLYNYIAPSGTGERYGMYTDVNTTTTNASATYGQYTIMDNDGTGNSYGLYINSIGLTTATEYGLYVVGEDLNYFSGKLGLGSTTITTHRINVVGTAGLSTGTAWTNTSDRRLKDIRGSYDKGLNEILKLNTVRFNYKKDNPLGLQSDREIVGFIAQEVEEVIPEAVTKRPDGYLELNVDPIHWAQINAIKELNSKIEKLCGRIEVLESENKSLKAELNSKSEILNFFQKEILKSNDEILRLKNSSRIDLKANK